MNGYIINPAIFYWINVLGNLRSVLLVIAVLAVTAVIVGVVAILSSFEYWHEDSCKTGERILKKAVPAVVVAFLLVVFIPTKDTLIAMMVAKMATYENAAWTVDALKEAVDYIVQAIASIK